MSKEKYEKTEGYNFCRYFTPASLTDSQTPKKKKRQAHGRLMPLTYQRLLDEQTRKIQLDGLNEQTAANRATALRNFLCANKIRLDDVVGDEMRLKHPEAIERLVHMLEAEGRSPRSISNTRAAFRPWRDAVIEHDTARALAEEKGTPFVQALKSVMADSPVKRVARQAGVPQDMLRGWLLGKQPRPSSAKYLMRIEAFFGLERSSLITLAGVKPRGYKAQLGGPPAPIQYNQTVLALTQQQYCCKPEPDAPLRQQWFEYLAYKTAAVPALKRTKRGKWRISPCPLFPSTDANWWAFHDGKEVASARMAWQKTSSYLGWLCLSQERGGKGLPVDSVQTLAWLAVPDFLEEYLDWCKERVGTRNQSATQFLAFVASLVRPRFGYLWQQPSMLATLPAQYSTADWTALCERQLDLTEQLVSAYQGEIEVSRDSFEPIRKLIELRQPMEAIVDMIQRMRANRPVGSPSLEATWARDLALIKLIISNPLRRRNLAHLTWRPDNTGELYQRADKSWWIRISKTKFKNRKGAAGDSIYDCEVQSSAWADLERYLFIYRPKLLRFPSDLVFLTRLEQGTTSHRPWMELSAKICELTAKYIPQCSGFRAHAFRHIVATSILKAEGGTHKTAARVLNDRVATIEKHYDGLTSNDGAREMGRLLGPQFSRM
ncbi:site-specific integrase [Chromobacterium violaceum]|uniref:site-specific integrase n=1 Tax=Chromobacterium violaceum TaxID=536 RepID=UPI001B34039C|nr:site-specific integrase [Chromobacterium violaceum]MBP4050906.1 site-specific integrase [Chromobacterium violaceum]